MATVKQFDKRTGRTYVYESISHWDKEKQQSRSKRKLIGKIDPKTGETVPTHKKKKGSYVSRMVKQDEWRTPTMLITPLLKYIKPNSTIWCPFDKESSPYVSTLQSAGHTVIHSHLDDGKDFFQYEPAEPYDFIISNPPFSLKAEVLDRLYCLGKPFAVLLPIECLNYQNIGKLFFEYQEKSHELELMIFDKKVSFNGTTSMFNSSYFCSQFLGKQLVFYHLEHNNTGKNFHLE